MTKSIKIDFTKLEKALSLSEEWFDLGGGLYASKVGKEKSKALFASKRAAGRDFIVVDTKGRVITAKDTLADLTGFQKAEKAVILAASTYESTIKDVLSLGLTWYVAAPGKAWAKLDKPRNGRHYAILTFRVGTTAGRWIRFSEKPLDTGLNVEQTTKQLIHLMKAPTPAVSSALFDKCYKQAAKLPEDKQRALYQEFDRLSKNTTSNFYTEVNDFNRARQDYVTSDKEAAAYMLALKSLQPKEKAPAAEKEDKKPATKKAVKTVKPVNTSQAEAVKPAPEKQASQPATGLQFGPALVADQNGKTTIASLLHAGKAFASRTVPADFEKRFGKYSEDNRLLLYLQGGPNLGQVSTYRGWLKQGRQVSKGQHGLKILAPRMVEKEDGTKAIDGLRLVTLFSVDQTEITKEA